MIAALVHGADCVDSCHATGKDSGGDPPFKRREICLQAVARRIRNAGIFVAPVFPECVLDVGRSGIDGDGYRASGWIRLLAVVDAARCEAGADGFCHTIKRKIVVAVGRSPLLCRAGTCLRIKTCGPVLSSLWDSHQWYLTQDLRPGLANDALFEG